jgi:hypothetical protein
VIAEADRWIGARTRLEIARTAFAHTLGVKRAEPYRYRQALTPRQAAFHKYRLIKQLRLTTAAALRRFIC